MHRKRVILFGLVVLASACSNSGADTTGATLLTTSLATTTSTTTTTVVPPTTVTTVPPRTTTTTTAAPTTTTAPATTSTTSAGTQVAAAGDGDTAATLVELPFTGAEPAVTLAALLILMVGMWLVQHSGMWQLRLARQEARWWRRPGAPSADPHEGQPWPPSALVAVTDADRQFRYLARTLSDRWGVSFFEGVDAYATRWVRSVSLSDDSDGFADDALGHWQANLIQELREIYDEN